MRWQRLARPFHHPRFAAEVILVHLAIRNPDARLDNLHIGVVHHILRFAPDRIPLMAGVIIVRFLVQLRGDLLTLAQLQV